MPVLSPIANKLPRSFQFTEVIISPAGKSYSLNALLVVALLFLLLKKTKF